MKANEDPASPIIEQLTIFPDCPLIAGTNTCSVTLIDIARKKQYATPVFVTHTSVPAEQPTHYVAKFNCSYINNFGQTGQFEADIDLWLSNFNRLLAGGKMIKRILLILIVAAGFSAAAVAIQPRTRRRGLTPVLFPAWS